MFKNLTAELAWGSVFRHLLSGVLGGFAVLGYIDDNTVQTVMSGLASLFPFVWSLINKSQLNQKGVGV